jgi:hypothetical protein
MNRPAMPIKLHRSFTRASRCIRACGCEPSSEPAGLSVTALSQWLRAEIVDLARLNLTRLDQPNDLAWTTTG